MNKKETKKGFLKKVSAGAGVILVGTLYFVAKSLRDNKEKSEDFIYDNDCNEDFKYNINLDEEDEEEKESKYIDGMNYRYSEEDDEYYEVDDDLYIATHTYDEENDEMVERQSDYDNYSNDDLDSLGEYFQNKYS